MKTNNYIIDVQINRRIQFPFTRHLLKKIIRTILNYEKVDNPIEISCVITDDTTIQKLNRDYRKIDQPTDVLSFRLGETELITDCASFPSLPEDIPSLGDIIISYPTAVNQARRHHHNVKDELILLLTHGTLHLLGYDHESIGDRRKMQKREKTIIDHIKQMGLKDNFVIKDQTNSCATKE